MGCRALSGNPTGRIFWRPRAADNTLRLGWSAETKGALGHAQIWAQICPPVDLPMYADPIQNAKAVQRFWAANIDLKKLSGRTGPLDPGWLPFRLVARGRKSLKDPPPPRAVPFRRPKDLGRDSCGAARRVSYSITSSARASSTGGTVIPRALAVLRLMTSSNFVGCSTGSSAGLAPLSTLSTKLAARRYWSG